MEFSEPVQAAGGGPPNPDSFTVSTTAGAPPVIDDVVVDGTAVSIMLGTPPPLNEWTTIVANIEDLCGNAIVSLGDLGPGVAEPDRLDFAFLPGDVNQDCRVSPLDLVRFRQGFAGTWSPPCGPVEDYLDITRNGSITPIDLLRMRQLLLGTPPATRRWLGEVSHASQP